MDMENRIAVLERDVTAIKSQIAVIRRDHVDLREVSGRLQRVEFEITQLQKGVSQLSADVLQLKADVLQLKADVLQLKEEVVLIRIELARLSAVQAGCATKADVGNLKGWMLGIALTVLSLNFGMNVIFFNAQKTTVAPQSAHALQPIPPEKAAPVGFQ